MIVVSIFVYISQLSNTVAANLMATVDEVSRHDVESIEGTLNNSYARLGSVAKRMDVYDVKTMEEAQEQLNLEAASSAMFNAIYLLDEEGDLYSSSYVRISAADHAYDELFSDGRDQFVMLYDEANGRLETIKESLIYGKRVQPMDIGGHRFIAILGRSDLSSISDQLLIDSFDEQGVSSVINAYGYYIVSASPSSEITGRDNFYDLLETGYIEDGITVDDVRRNISDGTSFTISFYMPDGQDSVISFAPIRGTAWSFIMTVPKSVFAQRFAPFIALTTFMLIVVGLVVIVMMTLIYKFMKRSVLARAESAARAEFLSNMSHEIRTPLNGIIGLNHLMERSLDDRQAMEGYVQKLGKAASYLLSLVNDILDVSKLQAGKVQLVDDPFDLRSAIENVWEMQREPMAAKGIEYKSEDINIPYPFLVGDEVRISQVLMNILSNAVKFTPNGGVITVNATQHLNAVNDRVSTTVSISDTGCGMSQDFMDHIFDVFTQERNSISSSQKGTGLGMSISHLLMEEMSGSLKVESSLGQGSRFTVSFTLPMDRSRVSLMPVDSRMSSKIAIGTSLEPDSSEAADENLSDEASSGALMAPIKLLVAEDNELNSEILSSILKNNGYEVDVTVNGQEALDTFAASEIGEYAAILMDAQMPVMDGYESAKEIRRLNRIDAETVRIFACTASTFTEDRNRALACGMDDFLAKPLDVPVMLGKLEQLRNEVARNEKSEPEHP